MITTYQQALDFWYQRVNYEQRGMPADLRVLKLDRMASLLNRLGHPERWLRVVHVAGSKGKGSTAAMLATILQHAGYRTGLFTSPHLCHVEERCQVDGRSISPEELTALMQELEPVVLAMAGTGSVVSVVDGGRWMVDGKDQGPASAPSTVHRPPSTTEPSTTELSTTEPTFFEIVTALAFLHFVRRRVELAVIEVGLGGRFDSTNVVNPLLSIITSISHDHTEQLGPTLAGIAREKAGIIKPRRPVVSGATSPEAQAVIAEVARAKQAPLQVLGQDFDYRHEPGWVEPLPLAPPQAKGGMRAGERGFRGPRVSVRTARRQWSGLELSLLGEHQAANAAVVLAALELLQAQGLHIPDEAVRTGLERVHWPARLEVIHRQPLVILDCAHNDASIQALLHTLHDSFPPMTRHLVFACSRDKDWQTMLALLAPHFDRACFTRYSSSQRGAATEDLVRCWRQQGGGPCAAFATAAEAWQAVRADTPPDAMICITGSVFLAGELRALVLDRPASPPP
jgi:dihydrofolate synthase/folylpolyglutamate synthase